MKSNLKILTYLLIINFLLVIGTLTYWQVVKKEEIYLHPRNKRLTLLEEKTQRGKILDRAGRVLAESKGPGGGTNRHFPYREYAGHLVGYNTAKYGKAGLEYSLNAYLLGLTGQEQVLPFLPNLPQERTGYDVVTTLDIELQKLGYQLLGDRKGAVVVLEPQTGAVLALVSKPSYDPNLIEENWAKLQQDNNNSPLLNRAVQGLYPPGSTLKVITGAGALTNNPANWERTFNAPGYIIVRGNRINDERIVGKIGFKEAMARSSNYVFATLGLEMGAQKFYQVLTEFGLNKKVEMEIPTANPILASTEDLVPEALAETSIGQGKTLVTPLHMALVASTIANGGLIPMPFLVDEIKDSEGQLVEKTTPAKGTRVIEEEVNAKLAQSMQAVVEAGTGKSARVNGVKVAGKTGSAENPHGNTHAWFIGFAPADNPEIALAVIVENGGAGGSVAGPIAKEIIEAAIHR